MTRSCLVAAAFLALAIDPAGAVDPAAAAEPQAVETLPLRVGDLDVVLRDNSRSPRVLSGVDSLVNVRDAPGFDAFDPDGKGASAGLNFEHIICGHRTPNNHFTPRSGPYTLHPLPAGNGARLVRRAEDDPWKVSSTLEYVLREPSAIDFEFRCTAQQPQQFAPHGYGIFFFADYMNDVAEVPLHFRGLKGPGPEQKESWIDGDAPKGPADWQSGGTYRHVDAKPLEYDKDLQFRLNSWSYDWPRYTEPFYFGRAAHGMTLILMFDRTYSPADEIRFSLFKFKLPRRPRPAWDFQYVVHNVAAGRQYGFRGRLVWKKLQSADDCRREYLAWRRGLDRR